MSNPVPINYRGGGVHRSMERFVTAGSPRNGRTAASPATSIVRDQERAEGERDLMLYRRAREAVLSALRVVEEAPPSRSRSSPSPVRQRSPQRVPSPDALLSRSGSRLISQQSKDAVIPQYFAAPPQQGAHLLGRDVRPSISPQKRTTPTRGMSGSPPARARTRGHAEFGHMHQLPPHPLELERAAARASRGTPPRADRSSSRPPSEIRPYKPLPTMNHLESFPPSPPPPSKLLDGILTVATAASQPTAGAQDDSWAPRASSVGLLRLLTSCREAYQQFQGRGAPAVATLERQAQEAWLGAVTAVTELEGRHAWPSIEVSHGRRQAIVARLLGSLGSPDRDISMPSPLLMLNTTSPITISQLFTPVRASGQTIAAEEHMEWERIRRAWCLRQLWAFYAESGHPALSCPPPFVVDTPAAPNSSKPSSSSFRPTVPATSPPPMSINGFWIGCADQERRGRIAVIAEEEQAWLRLWCGDHTLPTAPPTSSSKVRNAQLGAAAPSSPPPLTGPLEANPYYIEELDRLRALQTNAKSLISTELLVDSYLAALNERRAFIESVARGSQDVHTTGGEATSPLLSGMTAPSATSDIHVNHSSPTLPAALLRDVDCPIKMTPPSPPPPPPPLPPPPPPAPSHVPFAFPPTQLLQVEEHLHRSHLVNYLQFSLSTTLETGGFWRRHMDVWGTQREAQLRSVVVVEERAAFTEWCSGFWTGFYRVKQIECEKWEEEDRMDWGLRRASYVDTMRQQMLLFQRLHLSGGTTLATTRSGGNPTQKGWDMLRFSSFPRIVSNKLRRLEADTTQDRLLHMFSSFVDYLVGQESSGTELVTARELLAAPYTLPPLPAMGAATTHLTSVREGLDDFCLLDVPDAQSRAPHSIVAAAVDTCRFPESYSSLLSTYFYERPNSIPSVTDSGNPTQADLDIHFVVMEVPLSLIDDLQRSTRGQGDVDKEPPSEGPPRGLSEFAPLLTECEGTHRELLHLFEEEIRYKVIFRLYISVKERIAQRHLISAEAKLRYQEYAVEEQARRHVVGRFFALAALLLQGSVAALAGDGHQLGLTTLHRSPKRRGVPSVPPNLHLTIMAAPSLVPTGDNVGMGGGTSTSVALIPFTAPTAFEGGVSLSYRVSTEAGSRAYIEELQRRARAQLWCLCHFTPLQMKILSDEANLRKRLWEEEERAWLRDVSDAFLHDDSIVDIVSEGSFAGATPLHMSGSRNGVNTRATPVASGGSFSASRGGGDGAFSPPRRLGSSVYFSASSFPDYSSPQSPSKCSMALATLQLNLEPASRRRVEGAAERARTELLVDTFYPLLVFSSLFEQELWMRTLATRQEVLERSWLGGCEYIWHVEAELRTHAHQLFRRGIHVRQGVVVRQQ